MLGWLTLAIVLAVAAGYGLGYVNGRCDEINARNTFGRFTRDKD